MNPQPDRTPPADTPDPLGQTQPIGGRDRSHDPSKQPRLPHGGSVEELGPNASEEAKNQAATSDKSRAESGTP